MRKPIEKFPSPLGVSYFQIMVKTVIVLNMKRLHGFRPLSGYLISKLAVDYHVTRSGNLVSVPSRGILFPNITMEEDLIYVEKWFPSPLGVSYFQIGGINNEKTT